MGSELWLNTRVQVQGRLCCACNHKAAKHAGASRLRRYPWHCSQVCPEFRRVFSNETVGFANIHGDSNSTMFLLTNNMESSQQLTSFTWLSWVCTKPIQRSRDTQLYSSLNRENDCQPTSVKILRGTSWEVEKAHAAVVRSTFRSQNRLNTSGSEHFWKSASRCGAKHVLMSKVWKTHGFGAFLNVEMRKNCAPLLRGSQNVQNHARSTFWSLSCWRRALVLKTDSLGPLVEVEMSKKCTTFWCESKFKCTKHLMIRALFDVEAVFFVARAMKSAPG